MPNIPTLLKEVEAYYKKEGRSHLPWRQLGSLPADRRAYKILVSEVMLQQTQVERVLPFYKNFLKEFPTVSALAKAPLSKVLKAWQGLGYNRRAKFLQQAAAILATEGYTGQKLPGVGPYTAGAIDAFAFNKPVVFIETNIRTVFLYFCFSRGMSRRRLAISSPRSNLDISDAEILPLVAEALHRTKLQPREFYAALMDYGSYLKKQGIKLNKQSKHYVKQSKFEGSARQLRGAILRELLKKPQTLFQLTENLSRKAKEVQVELARLSIEGLLRRNKKRFELVD